MISITGFEIFHPSGIVRNDSYCIISPVFIVKDDIMVCLKVNIYAYVVLKHWLEKACQIEL